MLNVCRGLYNTTMNVKCRRENIEGIKCVCPECESFLQMCYLYNSYIANGISICSELQTGNADNSLLQCCRCIIKDEKFQDKMCQDKKWSGYKIINMQLDEAEIKHEWERFATLSWNSQEDLLFLLFLLMTISLKYREEYLCLADVICIYDEAVLEKRFRKMVNKLIKDILADLDGHKDGAREEAIKDLQRITAFFRHINFIYSKRVEIYDQASNYFDCLCLGAEKRGEILKWESTFKSNFSARLKKNSLDKALESFLFPEAASFLKKKFYNNMVIVNTFVNKCQEFYKMFPSEDVSELLNMLEQYHCEISELTEIRGLEKAAFSSSKSFKADSKLILDFLRKVDMVTRYQEIEESCWNVWESAPA